MRVVLGEDQGFRHLGTAGEKRPASNLVLELPEDGSDLAFRNHIAIELACSVGEILAQ